ncbi:CHAD domain-containing protein [Alkalibacter rhizosphaerae]|uniref:CHAD domain-containing protein n=1 Tax=Alkalibacter rhizosphaerae TaxID=2815577 RepID=A0A974XE74_9FIRM|nr:CHAD domain-containing protein [Alkalibacter rhizosphaerae]QSX08046.1 CHAD domain-containing protein [Alkalibacter rhizosphaerae]
MELKLVLSEKRIKDNMKRVTADVSSWIGSMDDVELKEKTVHDIRIVLRKLKSLMYFYKPLIRKKTYQKGQKLLSDALKSFENARESAVLLSALTDYNQHVKTLDPDTQNEVLFALEQWIEHFTRIHQEETSSPDTDDPKENWHLHVENWVFLMEQKPFKKSASDTRTKKFYGKRLRQMMGEWISHHKNLDLTDDDGIHKSRIQAKRIRYMLQSMDNVIVKNSDLILPLLASYQNMAGGLHDIRRFEEMLDIPAAEEMDLARICFLAYENRRSMALRKNLGQVKKKLVKTFTKNILSC